MNEIQEILGQLKERGWTWAAVASELEVNRETVSRWAAGHTYPDHPKVFRLALETLLKRRRIPKGKRYTKMPPAG